MENQQVLQLTVSQFSDRLRRLLEFKVPLLRRISIVGEISEWKLQANGNVYFTLKDDRAVLRCFAFSKDAKNFPEVGDGVAVVATGPVGIWERRSEYQLRVLELAPFGIGAMAAKVEALRRRLQAEGLFDERRKRLLPAFPQRVALVSARGKGAEDFHTTLREKAPNVAVEFVETRIQGEGAELDIADAIDRASRQNVEAVVVLRGGGSYEDRYPFNTEVVVRAIVRSSHPVITAIGHTGDRHLADEAADSVFKTPTAAAEYIAGSWSEVTRRIARQRERLERAAASILGRTVQRRDAAEQLLRAAIERRVMQCRQRLLELSGAVERQNPRHHLSTRAARLATQQSSLRNWSLRALPQWKRTVDTRQQRFDALRERLLARNASLLELTSSRLASADPRKPLERGYAIVTLAGRALSEARNAKAGDEIEARLYRGSLHARVERVIEDE
ncbi:MAG TPA: exodeoxyribonuclease VII large subunit [Candidatus Baltobacteraceae bacterium]|nr:exodeoxyribonuclease VII large subunit [Candidatus Baltobacteraceae bacterium]